ncbi:hypothetical protein Nepgr_010033 [Nepenthes gracilis]|uniref:Leucine-rich repeat-containing N-terminal plant-type domain-containing protein n=1 Tax=Nepenthes gracilis TaxID=150966 RepID=A0AAD3SBJ0_NEPGR|nr:hypothetical protein Nepgr_010033 [Nepenthes gracilis]
MEVSPGLSLLCVALLLFVSTLPPISLSACSSHDKEVLLRIKEDLGNPYVLASWLKDTDCCTDWYAVGCNSTNDRINLISIQYSNLSGEIPAAVGDLPYLQTIFFHKLPNLVGTIPETITALKFLQQLRITWTNITGTVPDFLSKIKSLNNINLSFNNLTGSIPSSLSELPDIRTIDLSRNKLTGSIPETFGSFEIQDFYIIWSHNQLSGPIPGSLGAQNFTKLDFSRNDLTGDASFLFGKNKGLQYIDLSRNNFSFDFSDVEFPSELYNLDLNHNKIYGTLPAGLTELSNLQNFNVSYNRLCGQIPTGGKLQSFDQYSYFHNKCLCGDPLPACQ